MSSEILADPGAQATPPAISVPSRIPALATRFYFHEALKQSAFAKHFVAEDLEAPPGAPYSQMYYFFKQNLYEHEPEFRHALTYYQTLRNYCAQPLAKSDVVKLNEVMSAEDAASSHFEVVLLFDLGESDRIDIDQIQIPQITKFLKSVCLLLLDLKNRSDLSHGNISIKNIILCDNELKISGFKPIFTQNPNFQNWKTEMCERFSRYRLDLYMIGLIWLRLLGSRIEELTAGAKELDGLAEQVMANYQALPEEKKATIVEYLLDLKGHPDLSLEDVILLFDEYFILETRRMMEVHSSTENSNTLMQNSLTDQERGSLGHNARDSFGGVDGNIFTKGLNDSGMDNMTFREAPGTNPSDGQQGGVRRPHRQRLHDAGQRHLPRGRRQGQHPGGRPHGLAAGEHQGREAVQRHPVHRPQPDWRRRPAARVRFRAHGRRAGGQKGRVPGHLPGQRQQFLSAGE
jgi:hypothetical protein